MQGTLIDVFMQQDRICVWIRYANRNLFAWDLFSPAFFVRGSRDELVSLADKLCERFSRNDFVVRLVPKRDFETNRIVETLRVTVTDFRNRKKFVEFVQQTTDFSLDLFHADIPIDQLYLFEKSVRPLQEVNFGIRENRLLYLKPLSFETFVDAFPSLKTAQIEVFSKGNPLQSFEAELEAISCNNTFFRASERNLLTAFADFFRQLDPDIVLVENGNKFAVDYLQHRFSKHGIAFDFGRFPDHRFQTGNSGSAKGSSYFSYGRIVHRDLVHYFKGRLHIDSSSFHFRECAIDGILELSYSTAMPIQKAAYKSSGTCISNLQLFTAYKKGYLIPGKKTRPERFDSAWHLFASDKGGLVLEPRIGLHENVIELDFSSLYPSIMVEHNLSPETVLCYCCENQHVPDCDYNVCEKRAGLVPEVIKPVLDRRLFFKQMKGLGTISKSERESYKNRCNGLKWLLVTSFGYTGYRNARFGRIECHQSICAFAREKLLTAIKICEKNGFTVLHGIVDAVYIQKNGFSAIQLQALIDQISQATKVEIVLEGIFDWIVFVPSRRDNRIATPTRFFGVYQNREFKIRGLELRKRDSPQIVKKMQFEQLELLAKTKTAAKFNQQIPAVVSNLRDWVAKLENDMVPLEDLVVIKTVSKRPDEYKSANFQKTALKQLQDRGIRVEPGEKIRYWFSKAGSSQPQKRVQAYDSNSFPKTVLPRIDKPKYESLLVQATLELIHFCGWTVEKLQEELQSSRQTGLFEFESHQKRRFVEPISERSSVRI